MFGRLQEVRVSKPLLVFGSSRDGVDFGAEAHVGETVRMRKHSAVGFCPTNPIDLGGIKWLQSVLYFCCCFGFSL